MLNVKDKDKMTKFILQLDNQIERFPAREIQVGADEIACGIMIALTMTLKAILATEE